MNRISNTLILAAIAFVAILTAASAEIILDQPPSVAFGGVSDTQFVNSIGQTLWEQSADDFRFLTNQEIRHITWWGFYGGISGQSSSPPPGDENMRVRFYDSRISDGLPGVVEYEETVLNVPRIATGRFVAVGTGIREYRFDLTLNAPFNAEADSPYWIELVQIGLPTSLLRWSLSVTNPNGYAVSNSIVPNWGFVTPTSLALRLDNTPEPGTALLLGLFLGFLPVRRGGKNELHKLHRPTSIPRPLGRSKMKAQRFIVCLCLILTAFASRASAEILLDQPPSVANGDGADTAYVTSLGQTRWALSADDFRFLTNQEIRHITWWGFYGGISGQSSSPPPGDENIRVRFHDFRTGDGLPGEVKYEETVLNVPRIATGRFVAVGTGIREYRFDLTLSTPFNAEADVPYWLAIAQLDIPTSLLRWSYSVTNPNGYAVSNQTVPNWGFVTPTSLALRLDNTPEPGTALLLGLSLAFCPVQAGGKKGRRSMQN